jgi:peptidyl-tRNA hydrolase
MNIRKYTSIRNGNLSKQPAQLLIVPHSQLNMTRHNPGFLVVSGSISSQLQHLFGKWETNFKFQIARTGISGRPGTGTLPIKEKR